MRKFILLIILICSSLVYSQTTSTSATVTYPDTNTFANGTVLATFTPPTGIIDQNLYLINGSPFPYYVTGTMDATGTFTIVLTDDHLVRPLGGRWMFTVCSAATVPCTNSLQDVFGASINLSTQISNDVAAIFASANNDPIYFADSEVKTNVYGGLRYFNYLTKTFRCWDGTSWSNCGSGGGGGGVSSFSSGNLSPLFTTTVTNPTTTPILSFTLSTAPAHTVYANETGGVALPSFQTDQLTINTTSPLTGGGLVELGGSLTIACPTCSVPQISITATSPIVVTPSPITGTGVISCPTCSTGGGGSVTSFSSGNLSPLFTTSVTNPTTTPALSFTLSNAPANTVFGNNTGSSATPTYFSLSDNDLPAGVKYKTCMMIVGADNGNALTSADVGPQGDQCYIPVASTIQEAAFAVDNTSSTSTLQIRKRHCSTFTSGSCTAFTTTNIFSGSLTAAATANANACVMASSSQTCLDGTTSSGSIVLNTTSIAAGDYIEAASGTPDGTTKRMSIEVTMTVN